MYVKVRESISFVPVILKKQVLAGISVIAQNSVIYKITKTIIPCTAVDTFLTSPITGS